MHLNKLELFFLLIVSIFNSLMAQDENEVAFPSSSEIQRKTSKLHRNSRDIPIHIYISSSLHL